MKLQRKYMMKFATAFTLMTATAVASAMTGQEWREKGDALLDSGDLQGAVNAYEQAESLGAGDEKLTMEKAQIYRDLDDSKSAYWEYHKNRSAANPEIRQEACMAMNELHWDRHKKLKYPYFADLSASGGYQSISSVSYIDTKFRYGRTFGGGENPPSVYAFFSASGDNRSGLVGGFPQEIYDNVAIAGVGIKKTLNEEWGISIFAEAGYAHDLVNLGRKRGRFDGRAGIEMYRNWNTDFSCNTGVSKPYRFVNRLSSSLIYYTRYGDTVLLDVSLKPGIRVYETPDSFVDAFIYLGGTVDFRNSNSNFGEAGVGIMWQPDRKTDLTISAMATNVFYNNRSSEPSFQLTFDFYDLW